MAKETSGANPSDETSLQRHILESRPATAAPNAPNALEGEASNSTPGVWQNVTGLLNPQPTFAEPFCTAFDETTNSTILITSQQPVDTWSYREGFWTNDSNSASSPPFVGLCAYDAHDGYLLYFGGAIGYGDTNETWAYRDGTWNNLTSATGPAPPPTDFSLSLMTYDAAEDEVLLLERVLPYNTTAQTWAYSGGNWTNLTTTAGTPPPASLFGAMTYDARDGYVVQFGGYGVNANLSVGDFENGTWIFQGGTWRELSGPSPDPRAYDLLTYDPEVRGVVMFEGFASANANFYNATDRNDAWVFSQGNWTNVTSAVGPIAPSPSEGTLVYDPADGYALFVAITTSRPVPWANQTWLLGAALPPFATVQLTSAPVEAGEPYLIHVRAVTVSPPLTYTYTDLPPGCAGANTSNLTCTTPTGGTFPINVEVTDAAGLSGNASAYLTIRPPVTVAHLTITPAIVHPGATVQFLTNVTGGIPPYSVSYTGLPPGCTNQNSASFSCLLSIPNTYPVSVTATDSIGFQSTNESNVSVYDLPRISSVSVSETWIDLGDSVTVTASATGGAPPVVYAYSGLPPGCPTGTPGPVLTCTPSSVGDFTFNVTATDALGASVSATSDLVRVGPDPSASSLTVSPNVITVGQPVTVSFNESGGVSPVRINWTSLPSGCNGTGLSFTCTPDAPGSYSVAVEVTDSVGRSANASTSLLVNPPPSSASPPLLEWVAVGGIAAILFVAGVVVLYRRRRRRSTPDTYSNESEEMA